MSIALIVHTVQVKAPPARAFDLFAGQIGRWWPGKTIGKQPQADIVIEPRAGGRWFERDAAGQETQWGKVLAWEPPSRLLLGWQINAEWRYDPNLVTEVELTFIAAEGGTRVTLEHRNLDRLGTEAARLAEMLRNGWPTKIDAFARHADATAKEARYA